MVLSEGFKCSFENIVYDDLWLTFTSLVLPLAAAANLLVDFTFLKNQEQATSL